MTGIMARAMRKPVESDEDNLQRDDIADEEAVPKDSLTTIYRGLCRRSESAAETAMALGQILERMVHSAIRNDTEGLAHWYRTCRELVAKVDEERGAGK